jgi:hypothetical protein
MTFIYLKLQFPTNTEKTNNFYTKKMVRKTVAVKTAGVYSEKHVTVINVTQSKMLKKFLKTLLILNLRFELRRQEIY